MARFTALSTVGLTVAAMVACAPPPSDTAADIEAIQQVIDMEVQSVNTADIDGHLTIFTADVKVLPPNEPMRVGTEGARAWLEPVHEQFTADLAYTESEVTVSGDWAIERFQGTLTLTPKAGGDPIAESVKGVHVLQRQADGSWKIAIDVWNSNTPLAGM